MPELPEVETTKKSLDSLLTQTISNIVIYQPKLRWQMPSDLPDLVGYKLESVKRRAKYLILNFIKDEANKELIIHLGMSGSLQQHKQDVKKRKHDHLIIDFNDSNNTISQLHYHDPRRFGAVLWMHDDNDYEKRLFGHLGVEPLTDDFCSDYLYNYIQLKQKKPMSRAIKSVIMEQKVVVGVGNIYATESLFMSGIHPATPANLVTNVQIEKLVKNIKEILIISIQKGGSSLKDFTTGEGKTGYFQQTLLVYGKEGEKCTSCSNILENQKINGRASVFCSQCQPLIK